MFEQTQKLNAMRELPVSSDQRDRADLEDRLIEAAVAALRHCPGLVVTLSRQVSGPLHRAGVDGQLSIQAPGLVAPVVYSIIVKHRVRTTSDLYLLSRRPGESKAPGRSAVITRQLTPALLSWCMENQLGCIDLAGNMHLEAPGLYLHAEGKTLPRSALEPGEDVSPEALLSTAGLKLLFVPLAYHRRKSFVVDLSYRVLAERTGVSIGSVKRIADAWEAHGFVARKNSRLHRLLNPDRLVDLWLANYPLKLRPKLNSHRFSGELPPQWWELVDLRKYGALIGGETAHWIYRHEVRPATQVIYVPREQRQALLRELAPKFLLRADPEGSLELLDRFWLPEDTIPHEEGHMDPGEHLFSPVVPPLMMCADLMQISDVRVRPLVDGLLAELKVEA